MSLLHQLREEQQIFVARWEQGERPDYHVLTSGIPGIFNLGGDLGAFVEAAKQHDRAWLEHYALLAIDVVYNTMSHYQLPVRTVTVVQGLALGGGFEAALSANILIAERQATFAFPETRFGLFPGMGAWPLLMRRLPPRIAEQFATSGKRYSAESLYQMGVVDRLAEPGQGLESAARYIQQEQVRMSGIGSMQAAIEPYTGINKQHLDDQVMMWVDQVLRLPPRSLGLMQKLTDSAFAATGAQSAPDAVNEP